MLRTADRQLDCLIPRRTRRVEPHLVVFVERLDARRQIWVVLFVQNSAEQSAARDAQLVKIRTVGSPYVVSYDATAFGNAISRIRRQVLAQIPQRYSTPDSSLAVC
jgi:hypothetical protein